MAPDPSARANGTERGCVEDQPQRVGSSKASRACSVLRLVEDDTAALRSPGTPGIGAMLCRCVLAATCYTGVFRTGRLRLSTFEQEGSGLRAGLSKLCTQSFFLGAG